MLVNIGTRFVPVVPTSGLSEVYFSGGAHGRKERGWYRFWTCCGEDKYGPFTIIGRARRNLHAGDRIARMSWERTTAHTPAARRIYSRLFFLAQSYAHYVRPATEREVHRWAITHKKDWQYAKRFTLRGKPYKRFPRIT